MIPIFSKQILSSAIFSHFTSSNIFPSHPTQRKTDLQRFFERYKKTRLTGANGKLLVLTSFLKELNYTLQLDQLLSVGSIRPSRSRFLLFVHIYPHLPFSFRFPLLFRGLLSFLVFLFFCSPSFFFLFLLSTTHSLLFPTVILDQRWKPTNETGYRRLEIDWSLCKLEKTNDRRGIVDQRGKFISRP